jgi:GT2 family glycosyltransferase
MENKKPILSIIIVSFNAKYFLYLTLKSLEKIVQQISIEVIVVDNGSADRLENISSFFPSVKFIQNKKNIGFGAANNVGVAHASSDSILILNPDTIISKNLITKGLKLLNQIENLGAIGVKMLDGKGNYLPESKRGFPDMASSLYKLLGLHKIFPSQSSLNQYYLSNENHDEDQAIEVISGACFFIKKTVYESVGGFDEKYFMYGEDIDISKELSQKGYQNYYIGTEEMIHFKGESSKKSQWNYHHHFYNAMYIFWNKNLNKSGNNLLKLLVLAACQFLKLGSYFKQKLKDIFLPILDASSIYIALYGFTIFWSTNLKGEPNYYPSFFYFVILPVYVFIWIFCLFLNQVYSNYSKISHYFKGSLLGALSILFIFSLLPENYRYSRAIVMFGTFVALSLPLFIRFIYAKWNSKNFWIIDFNTQFISYLPSKTNSLQRYKDLMNQYLDVSFEFKWDQNASQFFFDFEQMENEDVISIISKNKNKNVWFFLDSLNTLIAISHKNEQSLVYSKNEGHPYFTANNQLKQILFNRLSALGILIFSPLLYWIISKKVVVNASGVLIGNKRWFFVATSNFQKKYNAVFLVDNDPTFSHLDVEKYFRKYRVEEDFKLLLWACTN